MMWLRVGLCVGAATRHRDWPVVFRDAGPECPYRDDRQEREQCLEQATVDLAICSSADMYADHVLEDLANGKEKDCSEEVGYIPLAIRLKTLKTTIIYPLVYARQGLEVRG